MPDYPCQNCIVRHSCSINNRLFCSKLIDRNRITAYLDSSRNKYCPDCGGTLIQCKSDIKNKSCIGSCFLCNDCNMKINRAGIRLLLTPQTSYCWNNIFYSNTSGGAST